LSNFGRKKESKIALSPILVTLIVSLSWPNKGVFKA
jgi:hypothetical protein